MLTIRCFTKYLTHWHFSVSLGTSHILMLQCFMIIFQHINTNIFLYNTWTHWYCISVFHYFIQHSNTRLLQFFITAVLQHAAISMFCYNTTLTLARLPFLQHHTDTHLTTFLTTTHWHSPHYLFYNTTLTLISLPFLQHWYLPHCLSYNTALTLLHFNKFLTTLNWHSKASLPFLQHCTDTPMLH